jgi:hypothetical protein
MFTVTSSFIFQDALLDNNNASDKTSPEAFEESTVNRQASSSENSLFSLPELRLGLFAS